MSPERVVRWTVLLVLATGLIVATGTAAANQATITVAVEDRDGSPVADATLTVSWDDGEAVERTRSNGRALVDVPEGADVSVTVEHDEFVQNLPRTVEGVRADRDITVAVARKGWAEITAVDRDGPLEDARVRLVELPDGDAAADVRTDADGIAAIGPIERGEYRLAVRKGSYLTNASRLAVGEETTRTVELRRGSVQVRFTVVDDHFDPARPLEGASVHVRELDATLRTLDRGDATTAVPVNRRYTVEVTMDGYDAETVDLDVAERETATNVSVRRTPGLSVETSNRRVVPGETTRIAVADEYGDPVPEASVSLGEESLGATNDRGEYDVGIDAVGDHEIVVEFGDLSASVTVEGVGADASSPDDDGAGFGALVGLVALVAGGVAAARRY